MKGVMGTDELCFNKRYCLFYWHQTSLKCFKLSNELGKFAHLEAKFINNMQKTEADLRARGLQEATPMTRNSWTGEEGLELGSIHEIREQEPALKLLWEES